MKNTLLVIGVAAAVILSCFALLRNTDVKVDEDSIMGKILEKIGAFPGPDFYTPNNQLNFNGALLKSYGGSVKPGTTTPYSAISPVNASSTVEFICDLSLASTSAAVLSIAQSTGGFATTTRYTDLTTAAGAGGTIYYNSASTSDTAMPPAVVPPNTTYILSCQGCISGANEEMGTNQPAAVPKGTCTVKFWGI